MNQIDFDYWENVIIYKSLTDTIYLSKIIDHIKLEYFKNVCIAKIFGLIKAYYVKRDKLPTITELKAYLVTDELKNCFKIVASTFKDIDKNIDEKELIGNTEKFIKEKAIYNTMLAAASDLSKGKLDTSVLLNQFEQVCNINFDKDFGLDLFNDVEKIIDDLNNEEEYVSTGWEWVDKQLGGGLLKNGRSLYVFAGETNVGKSIVLGNIAANIVNQGKNVLLITLEMSELIYARRICSNVTRIPIKDLKAEQQTLRVLLKEEKNRGGKLLIKEFPPSTITPNDVKSFAMDLIASGIKIDAIVLDYINLLTTNVGSNSYEKVKYMTEQIRALSYYVKAPVVTATQLNRSGFGGKKPGVDTISESIGLAATADVIIPIFQSDEDRELNIIRYSTGKNRYGPKGFAYAMKIDYSTLIITDTGDGEEDVIEDDVIRGLETFSS
jgi:replicative DNA helicase